MNTLAKSRVITALVGIPLLILIIGRGGLEVFTILVFLVMVGALAEYFSMAFRDRPTERALGILLGVLVFLGVVLPGRLGPGPWLAVAMLLAFSAYLFTIGALEENFRYLGWTLTGVVYIGYFVPHLILLYRSHDGRAWVFFLLLAIMSGDTAAYYVGSAFGKKKLWPEVSPGKTVEGALASVAGTIVAGVVGARFLLPALAWPETVLLCVVLSILGQVGDLFESWIKRVFGVKDSGGILPGHGGLLDRLDSLIFPVVFLTYYLRLLRS